MKTGTTSIQATLAGNAAVLHDAGWHYLGWPIRRLDRISQRLAQGPDGANVVVVDEGWWHWAPGKRVDLPGIAALLHDFDITVVVYFRRPDQYVEAWYSQGLKYGRGAVRVADFLRAGTVNAPAPEVPGNPYAGINLRVLSTMKLLVKAFPGAEIVVRPYERRQLLGDSAVTDFLELLDLDAGTLDALVHPEQNNVTPDAADLLLISVLRQKYAVPEDLLGVMLELPKRPSTGRILTLDEAVGINDAMRPVFRKVQQTWGGGATDDFFLDWTINPTSYVTSPLRALHDQIVPPTP
ncbi:hypothetical protein GCM10027265_16850 [Jatrophihabitans fulvus]